MSTLQKADKNELFDNIKTLLTEARRSVIRNINQTMVYTYFEIGRMIVEDEQKGEHRAEYGEQIIRELSEKLTKEFGRGFSFTNLKQMRQFYIVYSIGQTLSDQLQCKEKQNGEKYETQSHKSLQIPHFQLSWSHYLKLMRIEDIAERQFYEIETKNNNWSLRELQRQYDSALYQRLALSKDKKGILELSKKGQIFASRYQTVLPSKEELKKLIESKN